MAMSPSRQRELYYENLQEYIFDENRIVSYKWLSLSLDLSINEAKQALYSFVERQRSGKCQDTLQCVYQVMGMVSSKGIQTLKLCLVKEDQLDSVKKELDPVLGCHLYSVSKMHVKDSETLFSVDCDIIGENLRNLARIQTVKCNEAVLRERAQPSTEETKTDSQPVSTNKQSDAKSAVKSKPSGVESMFAAAKPKSDSSKTTQKPKQHQKKQAGSNFFGNVKSRAKKEDVSETRSPETSPKKAETKASPVRKGDMPAVSKKSKAAPRRRRIQMAESSSEEDSESDQSEKEFRRSPSPEIIPASPEPLPKAQEQIEEGTSRRKRKVKVVNKTYLDDDGFMVTEKVYESGSCTDVSDTDSSKAQKAKVSSPPNKKQKVSPKKATKQAGILSFFGKK